MFIQAMKSQSMVGQVRVDVLLPPLVLAVVGEGLAPGTAGQQLALVCEVRGARPAAMLSWHNNTGAALVGTAIREQSLTSLECGQHTVTRPLGELPDPRC